MSDENKVGVVQAIKAAMVDFDAARAEVLRTEQAYLAAKATYSNTCEAVASAIPGDTKKVKRTIDGVARTLTFAKSGRGNTWSCRGLADREEEETLDLG